MTHTQKLFILISLILFSVYSQTDPQQFNKLSEYTLQPKGTKIEYSPNHQMLVQLVEGDEKFYVYSGMNFTFKKTIVSITSDVPTCLAFAPDSSFLILGTKNGNMISYNITNNELTYADKIQENSQKKSIKSIVVSNKLQIAVGGDDNNIAFYKLTGGKFGQIKILPYGKTIECLSYNSDGSILLVGGGVAFDKIQTVDPYKSELINTKTTHSISTYSTYYFQGTITEIEVLRSQDKQQQATIAFPNATYIKISQNGKYILACNGKNVKAWKITTDPKISFAQFPFTFETTLLTASLNLQNVLALADIANGQFQSFSLCKNKQFYTSQTNKCAACNDLCSICFQSSSKCYQCQSKAFLKQTECVSCGTQVFNCINCKIQNNKVLCTNCNDQNNFSPIPAENGSCSCKQSFYFEDKRCLLCSDAENMEGCSECNTREICKNCKITQHYVLNVTTSKCDCDIGYYKDKNKKCQICPANLIGCLKCSSESTCITCKTENHFKQKPENDTCICKDHYYLKDNACILCNIQNCQTCSINGATCDKCDQDYRVSTDKTKCIKCLDPGCIECTDKQCIACDKNEHFNPTPVDKKCVCQKEYYFKSEICNLCESITPKCLECLNDGSKCTKCMDGFYIKDGKCQTCKDGTNGCVQCGNDKEGNFKCTKCDSSMHLNIDPKDNKCTCLQTYYSNDGKCQLCSTSQKLNQCYICSQDGQKCSQCKKDSHRKLDENGSCACETFYYEYNKRCLPCGNITPNCLECLNDGSKCTNCMDGFYIKDGKCQTCKDGTNGCVQCYIDQKGNFKCNKCDSSMHLNVDPKDNKCTCLQTYYSNDGKCQLCSTSQKLNQCYICSQDGQKCSQCKKDSHRKLDENGSCACETFYYEYNKQCLPCGNITPNCLECLNDGSKCTNCMDGFYIKDGKCQTCKDGTNGCVQCYIDQKGNFKCNKCDSSMHLNVDPKDNKCTCLQTYYSNDGKCQLCSTSQKLNQCYICSQDGQKCSQCKKDSHRKLDEDGLCSCEIFYYEYNKQCMLCDQYEICKECNQEKICSVCNQQKNWQIKEDKCVCKPGFKNIDNKSCELCQIFGCIECQDSLDKCNTCSKKDLFNPKPSEGICKCIQNYVLKEKKCTSCSSLIKNCLTCDQSSCIKCFDTFIKANNNKSCICPQNFELQGQTCVDNSGLSPLLIAAMVVGSALIIASLVIGVVICCRKKKVKYQSVERDSKYDSLQTS